MAELILVLLNFGFYFFTSRTVHLSHPLSSFQKNLTIPRYLRLKICFLGKYLYPVTGDSVFLKKICKVTDFTYIDVSITINNKHSTQMHSNTQIDTNIQMLSISYNILHIN